MEEEKQITVKTADGERLLTEAETKRYRMLCKKQEELESKGYVRKDRIISVMKANTVGLLAVSPFAVAIVVIYLVVNGVNFTGSKVADKYGSYDVVWFFGTFVVMFACFFVHELIHGLFWSLGAENGFKDIELGFIAKLLTPYCTCKTPLKKHYYIIGSIMPMTILGIGAGVLAIVFGNPFFLMFSLMHVMGGAGDILITGMILKEKVNGKDVLIYDHPFDCGYIVFEKE